MCCGTRRSGKYMTRCAAGAERWCMQGWLRHRPVLACAQRHGELLQFGEDAIKEGMSGGPPSGMEDLFSMFTGGGMGGRRGAPRERRGENVVHRLKVSLEEMYVGSTRCAWPACWERGCCRTVRLVPTCWKQLYDEGAPSLSCLLCTLLARCT